MLLQLHNVPFDVQPPEVDTLDGASAADGAGNEEGARALPKCPIPIQKDTPTGLVDTICKNDVEKNHAGLCR